MKPDHQIERESASKTGVNTGFVANNNGVHLRHPEMDTTFCGEALEGFEDEVSVADDVPPQTITCRICNLMIGTAKGVTAKYCRKAAK